MLDGAAGEALHAVQSRAHHQHRLGIARADLDHIDRELFLMRSTRADRIAPPRCPATLGGAQKPGAVCVTGSLTQASAPQYRLEDFNSQPKGLEARLGWRASLQVEG